MENFPGYTRRFQFKSKFISALFKHIAKISS